MKYEDQIPDEDAIESLNSRLEKVDPLWYEFNDLQIGIELQTPDRAAENEEERAKFEDLYFDIVSPIKNMLKKHLHQFNPASEAGSQAPVENNVKSRVSFQPSVELEPIKIPKFHERYNAAKNLKLCIVCLRNTHPTRKCKSQRCFKCKKSHNVLLHKEIAERQAAIAYSKQSTASPADPASCTPQQQVSQPSNRSANEGSAAEISRNSSTNHSTLVSAIQNRKPENVQTYGNANSGVVGHEGTK
ncbi:hypothetical protein JTB14_017783 [Gonioctena quinquepunctata]|nr:hypothetical protein JTB14_017783 [Gonioctena quinquepunctata]